MTRNLKVLGLGLIAAFAMAAMAASAAHAIEARFTCGTNTKQECTIQATHLPGVEIPPGVFKTHAGNVECEEFNAVSTVKDGLELSELTLTELKYAECELGGLFATVVVSKGCHYTLFPGETILLSATGSVDVSATPEGCVIRIIAGACEVTVKSQTGKKSITYTNVNTFSIEEITAHANIEKIIYTTSASCPGGAGSFLDGKYEDTLTVKGFKKEEIGDFEQTNVTVVDA